MGVYDRDYARMSGGAFGPPGGLPRGGMGVPRPMDSNGQRMADHPVRGCFCD